MSQLFGAYGSQLRGDYVQPIVQQGVTQFVGKGSFLQPGDGPASLDPVDPSRYRPGTYVLPTQIELMGGYFDKGLQFWNNDPADNALVMPRDVYINQADKQVPVGYMYENFVPGDPRSTLRTQNGAYGTQPYGLLYQGAVNPRDCPDITLAGTCPQRPRQ